jgi:hypothetical protein
MTGLTRVLDSRTADRTVRIIAVLALLLSVWVGVRQWRFTQCVADYNDASNSATAARTIAADQDRQAQDQMFRAIAADPTTGLDQIRQYNDLRARADEARRQNPQPAPPSQRC